MTTDRTADRALPPELEAIAAAAHDRLHAEAGQDPSAAIYQAVRRVAKAASGAIADTERTDGLRARRPQQTCCGT